VIGHYGSECKTIGEAAQKVWKDKAMAKIKIRDAAKKEAYAQKKH
jgi:hypothetical protein